MYYTIYKTTNKLNNKIYIGKHQTDNPNDGYFGSGKAIKNAIKKYGKDNFIKVVLFIFDNIKDMNNKEKEIITEEFVTREDTYNLGVGGEGGPHFKGKTHTKKTKKILSESRTGVKHTKETKQKIAKLNKNRPVSEKTRKKLAKKARSRFVSAATRRQISESMLKYYANDSKVESVVKTYVRTEEINKKTAESMKKYGKIYADLIWIKNMKTKECFRINKDDFEAYEKSGFERGRILKQRGQGR